MKKNTIPLLGLSLILGGCNTPILTSSGNDIPDQPLLSQQLNGLQDKFQSSCEDYEMMQSLVRERRRILSTNGLIDHSTWQCHSSGYDVKTDYDLPLNPEEVDSTAMSNSLGLEIAELRVEFRNTCKSGKCSENCDNIVDKRREIFAKHDLKDMSDWRCVGEGFVSENFKDAGFSTRFEPINTNPNSRFDLARLTVLESEFSHVCLGTTLPGEVIAMRREEVYTSGCVDMSDWTCYGTLLPYGELGFTHVICAD